VILSTILFITMDYLFFDTVLLLVIWVVWIALGCLLLAVVPTTRSMRFDARLQLVLQALRRFVRRLRWLLLLPFLWLFVVSLLMDGATALNRRKPEYYHACYVLVSLAGIVLLVTGSWNHDDILPGALALLFWISIIHLAVRADADTDDEDDGEDYRDGPGPDEPTPTGDAIDRWLKTLQGTLVE
jgi:hypothetical protein